MKKKLFALTLILGVFCTAQAGYLIRGKTVYNDQEFKNFTLTLDHNDEPISAGSMMDDVDYGIVIVRANDPNPPFFRTTIDNINYPVEVRDFHHLENEKYILCGTIAYNGSACAFVAEVDLSSLGNLMYFVIHPEADIYYSIWVGNIQGSPLLDYYACGAKDNRGVIVDIDRVNLRPITLYEADIPWVYHKVIVKQTSSQTVSLVASGRDPDCRFVGFSVMDISSATSLNYYWRQQTEPASHSVLCDYIFTNNTIVLASSYQDVLTLNRVTFPVSVLPAYRIPFRAPTDEIRYCVQDIGIFETNHVLNPRISVAGYYTASSSLQTTAWFGSVVGLSVASIMKNYYFRPSNGRHEHYKIRGDQSGETYTGGHSEDGHSWGVLFGDPLKLTLVECDRRAERLISTIDLLSWYNFDLRAFPQSNYIPDVLDQSQDNMIVFYNCGPFKGATVPELAMPIEDESEITAFHDRITLKDTPTNTNYQIYNTIGQLIQTGATNPDISTANLSRGVYILRLENGKTVKFVK